MSHRNRMWKEKIICGLLTVLLLFGVGSRVYAAGEDGVSVRHLMEIRQKELSIS